MEQEKDASAPKNELGRRPLSKENRYSNSMTKEELLKILSSLFPTEQRNPEKQPTGEESSQTPKGLNESKPAETASPAEATENHSDLQKKANENRPDSPKKEPRFLIDTILGPSWMTKSQMEHYLKNKEEIDARTTAILKKRNERGSENK